MNLDDYRLLLARPSDLPPWVALISLVWAFIIGSTWGSFLNVVIARVPAGMSIVKPRSRCPKCEKPIAGYDNIPVLSWLILRGKCRSCKAPISARYPFLEAVMGIAGMAAVAKFGWSPQGLELFAFIFLLTAIAFVDLDTWTVPHPLWIALVGSGLALGALRAYLADDWSLELERVVGAGGAGLFLGALVVVATAIFRRTGKLKADEFAMGWGDPLILVGIGAYLGWRLLPMVLFFASVQGALIAIVLRSRGGLEGDKPVNKADSEDDWIPPKGAVPFGPFLALAALEAAFFGDAVLARALPMLGLGTE
jgi:leader peptidase (prepilin peptidase)/N-methyltransferase